MSKDVDQIEGVRTVIKSEDGQIEEIRPFIKSELSWIANDIEDLFLIAGTEEETQGICNALCRMITLIRERRNIGIDIDKISKEIQEVLIHDK